MIAAFLALALFANERITSGYLSYAPLARVVEAKGWQDTGRFDVLLATPDCGDVSRWAWVITDGKVLSGLIVDCAADCDRLTMIERQLVADTNRDDLTHRYAWIVMR